MLRSAAYEDDVRSFLTTTIQKAPMQTGSG